MRINCTIILQLFFCITAAVAQSDPRSAVLLTGLPRYHERVTEFYSLFKVDTTGNLHKPRNNKGLYIILDPYTRTRVHQVSFDEEWSGPLPMMLQFGQTPETAAKITGASLAVSPGYLLPAEEQYVVIKGGIAFVLKFRKGKLAGLYTIGGLAATYDYMQWEKAAFVRYAEGCLLGNCKDGPGAIGRSKDLHIGLFENGKAHGYGQTFLANGAFYHGRYAQGKRKDGVYFYPTGTYFSGEYNENSEPYKGRLEYRNGDRFTGTLKNNKPDNGTYAYSSGDSYSGQFDEAGKYTFGTLKMKDGSSFTGEFTPSTNAPLNGTLTTKDGRKVNIQQGKTVK